MRRKIVYLAVLVLLLCHTAVAQRGTFAVERDTSLSTSAEVLTIRLPETSARSVQFVSVSLYSAADVEFTLERDGEYDSGTNMSEARVHALDPSKSSTASAVATHTTTITGTTVIGRYQCIGGSTFTLSMTDTDLRKGESFTIRTESGTSSKLLINVLWREY